MQPIQKKLMNIQNYLVYSADLTLEDSGYYYVVVNHRPFSEGIPICQDWYTQGEDQEDAVDMAKDLIVTLAESFIEVGVGKTLTGLIKKINAQVCAVNIDNREGLDTI